jgi:outer membrane beta-barrel protein
MKRRRIAIGTSLLAVALCFPAFAQEEEPAVSDPAEEEGGGIEPAEEGMEGIEPEEPEEAAPSDEALTPTEADVQPTAPTVSAGPETEEKPEEGWKDIVVIPRKTVLKGGRVELIPYFSTTLNDNLIQHYALGGEINYFLTDILSVGVSGQYYFKNVLNEEFYTRYHFDRVPSLNKYLYSFGAHFSYVPVYGKFAILNDRIIHFEGFVSGGFGVSGTEVIPRDYQFEPFTNSFSLTFLLPELGGRVFLTRWMAIHFSYRNYLVLDKFEPTPRVDEEPEIARQNGESRLITNMMFNMGVSFFFPMNFKYTTFR